LRDLRAKAGLFAISQDLSPGPRSRHRKAWRPNQSLNLRIPDPRTTPVNVCDGQP
jgi:hypothetical protein